VSASIIASTVLLERNGCRTLSDSLPDAGLGHSDGLALSATVRNAATAAHGRWDSDGDGLVTAEELAETVERKRWQTDERYHHLMSLFASEVESWDQDHSGTFDEVGTDVRRESIP